MAADTRANGERAEGGSGARIFALEDARPRSAPRQLDPADYISTGAWLEAARAAAGLSVAEAAGRTRIRSDYLKAIEAMDLDRLPGRAYALGFVRSYADALGLDADRVVARFREEAGPGGGPPAAAAPPPGEPGPTTRDTTAAPPPRRELSLIAVLAVIGFMVWTAFLVTRPREADPAAAPTPAAPRADRATGVSVGERLTAAVLDKPGPVYPPECASIAAPTETVDVLFTVTASGGVVAERAVAASNPCFERAALNAVRQWRFEPALVDGAPAPVYDQRVRFVFDRPD